MTIVGPRPEDSDEAVEEIGAVMHILMQRIDRAASDLSASVRETPLPALFAAFNTLADRFPISFQIVADPRRIRSWAEAYQSWCERSRSSLPRRYASEMIANAAEEIRRLDERFNPGSTLGEPILELTKKIPSSRATKPTLRFTFSTHQLESGKNGLTIAPADPSTAEFFQECGLSATGYTWHAIAEHLAGNEVAEYEFSPEANDLLVISRERKALLELQQRFSEAVKSTTQIKKLLKRVDFRRFE